MKKALCLLFSLILLSAVFVGCTSGTQDQGEYSELISDLDLNHGMRMTASSKENPMFEHLRTFDYGGKADTSYVYWRIFQWANYKHPLDDVAEQEDSNVFTYESESTKVVVDRNKKELTLGLYTSKEYVDEEGNHQPRVAEQHWPSLYFDQNIAAAPQVGALDELIMDIEFTITKMDSMMTEEEFNPNLHTAQFMWYLTIINKEKFNGAVNDYLWYGPMYYDARYEFTEDFGQQDTGKDDATGKYIYCEGMKEELSQPVAIGEKVRVTMNVLPGILNAIQDAQQKGYLQGCIPELLKINYMNIGWEIPGTFDCEVVIHDLSLKAKLKEA